MNRNLDWLLRNGSNIVLVNIERSLSIPTGTVHKFVTGERGLPCKWQKPVIKWIIEHRKL